MPLEVSTQVVAGKNYRFLCDATPATKHPQHSRAMVEICQPLNGDPVIEKIDTI